MWILSKEIDGYYHGSKTVIKSSESDSMVKNRFVAKTTNQTRYGWKGKELAERDAKEIVELHNNLLIAKTRIKELEDHLQTHIDIYESICKCSQEDGPCSCKK